MYAIAGLLNPLRFAGNVSKDGELHAKIHNCPTSPSPPPSHGLRCWQWLLRDAGMVIDHGGMPPLLWHLAEHWGHRPPQRSHRLRTNSPSICATSRLRPVSSFDHLEPRGRSSMAPKMGCALLPWACFPEISTSGFEKFMMHLCFFHTCFDPILTSSFF